MSLKSYSLLETFWNHVSYVLVDASQYSDFAAIAGTYAQVSTSPRPTDNAIKITPVQALYAGTLVNNYKRVATQPALMVYGSYPGAVTGFNINALLKSAGLFSVVRETHPTLTTEYDAESSWNRVTVSIAS